MDSLIQSFVSGQHLVVLLLIAAALLGILAKSADILVDQAVALSRQWGVPTIVIGATIVSLGTTLPEAAVSVAAAVKGNPGMALGNAVGSIICDTGLILGLALLLGPIPLDPRIVNRQGWIQVGSAFLLIFLCLPLSSPATAFTDGGHIYQWSGILLVILLVVYLGWTIRHARELHLTDLAKCIPIQSTDRESGVPSSAPWRVLLKLAVAIAGVVLASKLLIPTVQETAIRLSIPESMIAATLVAFGTSLPELVTAITSVRKGQGGLALGNIIGADILNVLFVAGVAIAVTPGGLAVEPRFFQLLFPAMAAILIIFRLAITFSGTELRRGTGFLLLGVYFLLTTIIFVT